jgi:hypothetical protein
LYGKLFVVVADEEIYAYKTKEEAWDTYEKQSLSRFEALLQVEKTKYLY